MGSYTRGLTCSDESLHQLLHYLRLAVVPAGEEGRLHGNESSADIRCQTLHNGIVDDGNI